MNRLFKKSSIIAVLLMFPFLMVGQQRTGNIVEYFGKEKVESIHEGKVVHVFNKGLALTLPSLGFDSSTFPLDPVFDKFLMEPAMEVSKGGVFDIDYLGREMRWNPIEVDSTNSFSGRELRSGYVYLSYRSGTEKIVLFEASGHSLVAINGLPYEGDHYDFGWNIIPLKLNKGNNVFVLKVGRFPRIRARLLEPKSPVQFTTRDITVPDLLIEEETMPYMAAIRVVNSTGNWIKKYAISAKVNGKELSSAISDIPPFSVYKMSFAIPPTVLDPSSEKVNVGLELKDSGGKVVSTESLPLNVRSKYKHHSRTFISGIDGSVQYYSVA